MSSLGQARVFGICTGYSKLVGFESAGGGFEWFGGSPGHEALSAYGVLQFEDMAKVRDVVVLPVCCS